MPFKALVIFDVSTLSSEILPQESQSLYSLWREEEEKQRFKLIRMEYSLLLFIYYCYLYIYI